MSPSPRQGCSATPSSDLPSSSWRYNSRPRRSSTSCPGVMHHPPLPPGPGLSLPVAVGTLLRLPELLRPRPNRHIGWCVEPLAGERRPPRPSQAPSRPGSRRSGPDAGNPEMLEFALYQETARTAPLLPPVEGREENLLFHFVSVPPLVHIPGQLNRVADALSRQLTFPGEWRLHPETIRLIWSRFGDAQVDLFASPESSHCQLYFSLTEGPLGTDALAHSWPRALRKYAFSPVSLLAQTLCKLREDEEQVLLVAPHWPTRTWFPELISLATAPPWRIPPKKDLLFQGLGTIWHPRPDLWNLHVWHHPGWTSEGPL